MAWVKHGILHSFSRQGLLRPMRPDMYLKAKYKGSISRGALVLWGPTSDLARDPRWGRNDESFSEDAYLTGTMVMAYVKGIGVMTRVLEAASLLKHIMANSNETTARGPLPILVSD